MDIKTNIAQLVCNIVDVYIQEAAVGMSEQTMKGYCSGQGVTVAVVLVGTHRID